jgi:AcrR family transcriptional regulator
MKIRARQRVVPSRVEKRLTEQKVVAAALEHIDAVGLPKFRLCDVARALDVSRTAVYWFVKTPDGFSP